jgi:MtaA/CmuA family methyltransferase
MTGKERVLGALSGAATDRLPLMPITMMFAADTAGIRYRDYATDHTRLAEAQWRTAEEYGFDYVSAISDPAREATDLGAVVQYFDDQPPAIVESQALLADKGRLGTLRLPGLAAPGRMRDRVEGVALLAGRASAEKIVEGWVEGPCAMAADLRGLNTLMLDFYDDPGFVEDLFAFVVAMETEFARAQITAGASLIGVGDAAASLIGPRFYEKFVFDQERKLVGAIHGMGCLVRLHICGNTRRILRWMGQTGADIVDLDFLSPLEEARAAMGSERMLLGNIDPVRVLRDGEPDSIEAALAECHRQAGMRYIVGAGCEIPRGTPRENVLAMARYAQTHHA